MPQTLDRPARRFQLSLRTLFALITTAIVTFGLFAWIAPYTGMGNVAPMFLLFFATWAAFSVLVCRAFARSAGIRLLIVIALFFVTYASFGLAFYIMSATLHAIPPPRPMFHNYFGEHERVLLPYWHQDWAMSDGRGNLMWADHQDNTLVTVLHGEPDGLWTGPITGQNETRFAIGDGSSDQWATIRRSKNVLIVIRPDGNIARFALPPNVVRGFHEERRSKNIKDLIVDVGLLLDADSQTRLDSFASNVHGPPNGG